MDECLPGRVSECSVCSLAWLNGWLVDHLTGTGTHLQLAGRTATSCRHSRSCNRSGSRGSWGRRCHKLWLKCEEASSLFLLTMAISGNFQFLFTLIKSGYQLVIASRLIYARVPHCGGRDCGTCGNLQQTAAHLVVGKWQRPLIAN